VAGGRALRSDEAWERQNTRRFEALLEQQRRDEHAALGRLIRRKQEVWESLVPALEQRKEFGKSLSA